MLLCILNGDRQTEECCICSRGVLVEGRAGCEHLSYMPLRLPFGRVSAP